MNTPKIIESLTENTHKIVTHHFKGENKHSDLTELIGQAMEQCTLEERLAIIEELGLCWFVNEFDVVFKGFPVSENNE